MLDSLQFNMFLASCALLTGSNHANIMSCLTETLGSYGGSRNKLIHFYEFNMPYMRIPINYRESLLYMLAREAEHA